LFVSFYRINDAVSLLRLYSIVHSDSKIARIDFTDTDPSNIIQTFIETDARIPDLVSEALRQSQRKQQSATNG